MSELPYEPALVHVTGISPEASAGLRPAAAPYRCHLIPRTVVLTADEPVKQLLRPGPNREQVFIIARTNDVVLTETKGDAQAPGNTGDVTLANPNGGVIPHDILIGPLKVTDELWAAAAAYPTRVTVLASWRE